jgi:hypothetical protein
LRFNQDDFSKLDGAERQFDTSNKPHVTAQILFGSGRMLMEPLAPAFSMLAIKCEASARRSIEWPRAK